MYTHTLYTYIYSRAERAGGRTFAGVFRRRIPLRGSGVSLVRPSRVAREAVNPGQEIQGLTFVWGNRNDWPTEDKESAWVEPPNLPTLT